jgi:transcription factor C subunit 6
MTPTHYIAAHQSAIRSLAWVTAPPPSALDIDTSSNTDPNPNREYLSYTSSPDTLVSTGYDGVLSATSLPLLRASGLSRTRDALHACAFSCWAGAALGTDHEHVVKAYSLAPSMLGRGHLLCEPRGPSWVSHFTRFPLLSLGVLCYNREKNAR